MRGADLLVRTLSGLGVHSIFTLSGNQIMSVFDASLDAKIDLIHVRQEAAAVHAADTWGRLTGEPGVALVTAGPGFANTLTALYVAMAAESPLVLLSGHAALAEQGRGAFQEMAQAEMARHVTKVSWASTSPAAIGHDLARAFRLARSGRPGPVHLALPVDILEGTLSHDEEPPLDEASRLEYSPTATSDTRSILDAIRSAKRPVALPGQAVSRSGRKTLSELRTATGVPFVSMESPRGINDPSLGAFAEVLAEADLVVLLGKRLDFGLRFGESPALAPDSKVVHVDHDESALEQTRRALNGSDRLIVTAQADPIATAELISQSLGASADSAWAEEVQAALSYAPPEWGPQEALGDDGPLHPLAVCRAVQDILDERESALICDGGEFGQWTQARLSSPRRIINGPGGSIGTAIPAALAARAAYPDATVITLLGDGTFGFHAMEFDTAVRHNLPFVAVVGNDAKWNAEYQIQLREYGPDRMVGCELNPARYDLVVQALGGHGENVTTGAELTPALRRALNSGLPACVNVAIQPAPAPVVRRA
ncbi:MAG: thiamine pyrophosphate-binding protein [Chloroflexi bacterium]|nr:thiamine pyrophosphate-binding protein [Chloroflexota bacterium]